MKRNRKFGILVASTALTFATLWFSLGQEKFNQYHNRHHHYYHHEHHGDSHYDSNDDKMD